MKLFEINVFVMVSRDSLPWQPEQIMPRITNILVNQVSVAHIPNMTAKYCHFIYPSDRVTLRRVGPYANILFYIKVCQNNDEN